MPDQREIYNQRAERYDCLVAREDCEGNLLPALMEIDSLEGRRVVELGAGTGRLTRLLAPLVSHIWLFDRSHHMLEFASWSLSATEKRNWELTVADHRNLPLVDGVADVVISGWSICYLVAWGGPEWRTAVAEALTEMERVLEPGGTIILLETLGTGNEQPEIPSKLRGYYETLEAEGFSRRWIRTDLAFDSLEEARELMGFFFGEEMARRVEVEEWVRVPECTGIWWKRM